MIKSISFSFLVLLLAGCSSTNTITKEDLSFLYDQNTTKLHLPARVYHVSDTKSELHFKLTSTDLLYRRGGEGDPFASLVRVHFDAYDASDRRILLDSATIYVTDLSEDPLDEKELFGFLPMKRFKDREVLCMLRAHDLYRDIQSIRRIEIKHQVEGHRQNFIIHDPGREVPLLRDQLTHPQEILIEASQYKNRTLYGSYFNEDKSIPAPVFSTRGSLPTQSAPDSVFNIQVDESGRAYFNPQERGIYHLQIDTTHSQGLSVVVLGKAYPSVRTTADMIEPLKYITSKEEYAQILNSDDRRKAIEGLWIDLAGGKERARNVIKAYYKRVENANEYFTSHKEGWRTDRGLVHIVFGIPNTIHKSEDSETWIYGEESSLMSMQFIFIKQNGLFSDNDLKLDRDPSFKSAWYRNVESWRNGRVYEK